MKKKYSLSALGGTFDHFHAGHIALISAAGRQSQRLLIGVTTDEFAKSGKRDAFALEPYAKRVESVREYCDNNEFRCEIVTINSTDGTAGLNANLEALFYTKEVQNNAEKINLLRKQHDNKPLSLIEVPLLPTEDGRKISSELIRSGQIDRQGTVYKKILNKTIMITAKQRKLLATPLGERIEGERSDIRSHVIVVGDATLRRFQEMNLPFNLAIIDGKIQRQEYRPLVIDPKLIDLIVVNPSSHITPMLADGISLALKNKLKYVYVDGEEDLAAIVALLLVPLGAAVYYGQPNEGMIEWVATEQQKAMAYQILSQP